MEKRKIVSREEWIAARKEHLAKEKQFTRLRDDLSRQRRELPWVKVDKAYTFEAPGGKETLPDLFGGRSQLVVYHFMYPASWKEGCKSCSFWADNFDGIIVHLNARDVSMVFVSKAPLEQLEAFKKRMGWSFKWVSSANGDFNADYGVSFTAAQSKSDVPLYNYGMNKFGGEEAPGMSVLYKDEAGDVFHTYSCYSRGLDMLNGAYHVLDLVPKGRDEEALSYGMAWLRHHDRYGA